MSSGGRFSTTPLANFTLIPRQPARDTDKITARAGGSEQETSVRLQDPENLGKGQAWIFQMFDYYVRCDQIKTRAGERQGLHKCDHTRANGAMTTDSLPIRIQAYHISLRHEGLFPLLLPGPIEVPTAAQIQPFRLRPLAKTIGDRADIPLMRVQAVVSPSSHYFRLLPLH